MSESKLNVENVKSLRDLYRKRMDTARTNSDKYRGKEGEQEWLIQFHMARGKVEVLEHLLKGE